MTAESTARADGHARDPAPPWRTFTVASPHQARPHTLRVLAPDAYVPKEPRAVLYALPVEPEGECRYGDPMAVLHELDAANRFGVVIVTMGFDVAPWYADHPTDPHTRQASYLRDTVVPFVEQRFATFGGPEGRLLLGFSKSGWGALSLIGREPEFYGCAASWDAPLLLDACRLTMGPVFGADENMAEYQPIEAILRHREHFVGRARLVLTGEAGWGESIPPPTGRSHTREAHKRLDAAGVLHHYDDRLVHLHRWHAGWLEPTLVALMRLARDSRPVRTKKE